jgi:hypothetical protein
MQEAAAHKVLSRMLGDCVRTAFSGWREESLQSLRRQNLMRQTMAMLQKRLLATVYRRWSLHSKQVLGQRMAAELLTANVALESAQCVQRAMRTESAEVGFTLKRSFRDQIADLQRTANQKIDESQRFAHQALEAIEREMMERDRFEQNKIIELEIAFQKQVSHARQERKEAIAAREGEQCAMMHIEQQRLSGTQEELETRKSLLERELFSEAAIVLQVRFRGGLARKASAQRATQRAAQRATQIPPADERLPLVDEPPPASESSLVDFEEEIEDDFGLDVADNIFMEPEVEYEGTYDSEPQVANVGCSHSDAVARAHAHKTDSDRNPLIARLESISDDWQYGIYKWPITLGRKLGKSSKVDCPLGPDKTISRQHAMITLDTAESLQRLVVECIGRNRVRVNGSEFKAADGSISVNSGDVVQVGPEKFVLHVAPVRDDRGLSITGVLTDYMQRFTFSEQGSLGITFGEIPNPLDEAGPTLATAVSVAEGSIAARTYPMIFGHLQNDSGHLVVLEVNNQDVSHVGFDGTLNLMKDSARPLTLKMMSMEKFVALLGGELEVDCTPAGPSSISYQVVKEHHRSIASVQSTPDGQYDDAHVHLYERIGAPATETTLSLPRGKSGSANGIEISRRDTGNIAVIPNLLTPTNVVEMARYLGIDSVNEPHLLHVAHDALLAELPPGWVEEIDAAGLPYYVDAVANRTSRSHPADEYYVQLLEQKRAKGSPADNFDTSIGFWEADGSPYTYDFCSDSMLEPELPQSWTQSQPPPRIPPSPVGQQHDTKYLSRSPSQPLHPVVATSDAKQSLNDGSDGGNPAHLQMRLQSLQAHGQKIRKIAIGRARRNLISGVDVVKFNFGRKSQSVKKLWLSTDKIVLMWAGKREFAGTTSVALADVCDCTFGACTENFRKHGLQSLQTGQCFSLHIKKRTFDFGCKHPKTARQVVLAIRNLMSIESVSEGSLLWMAARWHLERRILQSGHTRSRLSEVVELTQVLRETAKFLRLL